MLSGDPSAGLAEEIRGNAGRLGMQWQIFSGTVQEANTPTNLFARIRLDGDPADSKAWSMVGPVIAGDRVSIIKVPPEGAYIVGWANIGRAHAAVRVSLTAVPFANGVFSAVPWEQADYDSHGFWSSSAPTILTMPFDGKVAITMETQWAVVAGTGVVYIDATLGATRKASHRHPGIASDRADLTLGTEFEVLQGEQLVFNGLQTSGGNRSMDGAATVRYVG